MYVSHKATESIPNYVRLYESGELERRVEQALAGLRCFDERKRNLLR